MAEGVQIRELQVLSDLRNSLGRFGSQSSGILQQVELRLRQVEQQMEAALTEAQRDLEDSVTSVHYAVRALEDCESQEDDDYTPDCSNEYEELQEARHGVSEAERRLEKVRRSRQNLDRKFNEYRVMAGRLKRVCETGVAQAQSMLNAKIGEIEQYVGMRSPEGAYTGSYTGESLSGRTQPSLSQDSESGSSPGPNTTGSHSALSEANSGWVERGIHDVELRKLPDPDGIEGEKDFKKVPMNDMEAGLRRFSEIKETLRKGKGRDKDYWVEIDRRKGLSYQEGYQRVYEAFFGRDPIRVTKDGEKYTIENGRHRVWLAKRMGIQNLPMSVVEKGGPSQ